MRYAGPEGAVTLFTGLDLTIAAGESVAILGASGSGKSTLLGLLAGLEQPSEGQIWLADAELTALDEDGRAAVRGSVLGFIFQAFHLLPGLTAVENVRLALELTGGGRGSAAAAQHALERVGLGGRLRHTPERLSGGEQQRVAIARAIVTAPQVVMADEPTGNLDDATGKEIIDLLFTLNHEQGTTLVIVTHDPRVAERCQRVCHFRDGGLHE
ncbi:ABC transporter ATP-binding protein [Halorhodospira abdelmalekii]|uniref:ABC transporter ATP-binding protein n=1 Tax=Halorhodospira abdelmalekii TaxID=421629 RepID=UPI001F5BAA7A|nr:ABC transporter ATP-binding protein [Halorhodospira abdelmalekii]